MALVDDILGSVGFSREKIQQARDKFSQKQPTGLAALPAPVQEIIGKAVGGFAAKGGLTEQQAGKAKSILDITRKPSPVIKPLSPEEDIAGAGRAQEIKLKQERPFAKLKRSPVVTLLSEKESFGTKQQAFADILGEFAATPFRIGEAAFGAVKAGITRKIPEAPTTAPLQPLSGPTQLVAEVERPSRISAAIRGAQEALPLFGGEGRLFEDPETDETVKGFLAVVLTPALGILAKLAPEAKGALLFKDKLVAGNEVKLGLQQLTTGNKVGATKDGLKVAQNLINSNKKGGEIFKTLREGATIKVKRNFVKWFQDLVKINPKPSAEVTALLDDIAKTGVADEAILNSYANRAIQILRPSPITPGLTTLKPVAGVPSFVQENVAFAKEIKKSATPPKNIKLAETKTTDIKNFDDSIIKADLRKNRLAERILESNVVGEEVKALVRDNPSSYHEVISDKDARAVVSGLKEEDLTVIFNQDNSKAAVFAGQRLSQMLQEQGRFDENQLVIDRAQQLATTAGQVVQAQKIWSEWLTPKGKLTDLEKDLDAVGKKLTPEQSSGLLKDYESNQKLKTKLDETIEKARGTMDPKDLKAYREAQKIYNTDIRQLSKTVSGLSPAGISKTLTTIMQGNILTPLSQIKNPLYNIFFTPFNVSTKAIASLVDAGRSFITKKPRTVKLGSPVEFLKGLGIGTKEAADIVKSGALPDDPSKVDNLRQLHPLRALSSAFTGKGLPVSKKTGKPLIEDRIDKMIEGVFGIPAEVMFRALAIGDKPFFRAVQRSTAAELANLKGLKGVEKQAFIEFPAGKDLEEIEKFAKKAVFQQDNIVSRSLNAIDKLVPEGRLKGMTRFLFRTQAPFIKTPTNVVSETVQFLVPEISFMKAAWHASKGQTREAQLAFGRGATGIMVLGAAGILVTEGVVNGDVYDGAKKDKLSKAAGIPPRHINLSGLKRLMNGENPKARPGDEMIRYDLLGIFGAALETEFAKEVLPASESKAGESFAEKAVNQVGDGLKDLFVIGSFAMEQSFLQGTNVLLNTIADIDSAQGQSNFQKWFRNTFQLVAAIPLPNTLSALTRADDDIIRETKGKTTFETLENVIKARLFDTEDLPAKVGLYGEELNRTPEGRNPFVFNLLDPFKFNKIKDDRTYQELNKIFEATKDQAVIPSIVDKGEMSNQEYEVMLKLVGRSRKILVDELVDAPFYNKLSNPQKAELFGKLHEQGRDIGKALFNDAEFDESTLVQEWGWADDNPNATRTEYGATLNSLGKTINKSGEANANDWRDYLKRAFALKGNTLDNIDSALNALKGESKDDKQKLLNGFFSAGAISDEEFDILQAHI